MRLLRSAVLAAAALVVCASAASATVKYEDLRHDNPSIDAAVASMTNSDIHGTFNRISAILNRSAVASLEAGAGTEGLLPRNAEDGLQAALADLYLDLKQELGAGTLTLGERYTIIQTVDVAVGRRIVQLYQGWEDDGCIPDPEIPCPPVARPEVLGAYQNVVLALRGWVTGIANDWNTNYTSDPSYHVVDAPTSTNYSADNFTSWVADLGDWGRAVGVPSIDD